MTFASKANFDAIRFGRIVRRLRTQRGWKIAKLAQRAGISPQYLNILEKGLNVPSLPVVLDLVESLGADIAEVMRELANARTAPLPAPASE